MKKILLVAKPWRGGLAHYVHRAMQAQWGEGVRWLFTAPVGLREKFVCRQDKAAWRRRLTATIEAADYDLALFINFLPEFSGLCHRPQNILWLTDDPRSILPLCGGFGAVFLSDPGYLEECRALPGAERLAGILPFGFDPEIHTPQGTAMNQVGLCFIANRDPKRDQHLQRLFSSGLPVQIYGNYFLRTKLFWQYPSLFHPAVPFRRMEAVYARHLASLNIHARVVRGGTNMRTFECAGYGIPQVVEYRPGLEEYFDPGEEVLVYRNLDELEEMSERILNDLDLRRLLAGKARSHAMDKHSYRKRLEIIQTFLN
jgi:hypothetical protein